MSSIRPDPNLLKKYPNALTQADIDRRNRFLGVLPGLAVGDALGAPVESQSAEDVAAAHPEGIREITGGGLWEKGEPTDDTQLALLLTESLAQSGRLNVADLARRLVAWLESSPKDIGNLTRQSLQNLRGGDPPDQSGAIAWEDGGRKSAGNGSLMYIAPIALSDLLRPDEMADDATTVSRITHYDPRCVGACVALTHAIAGLVRGDEDALASAALAAQGISDDVRAVIERALARPPAALKVDGPDRGFVLVTLELAFSAATYAQDFESALIEVVSKGGDADTNGAVAGALLGAKFGRNQIPERWMNAAQAIPRLNTLGEKLHRMVTGK